LEFTLMNNRRPPQLAGPYRTEVAAVVKWYNRTKGFGFVKPNDGAPDAFLHASLVAQAGHDDLADGTSLVCDIAEGPRGPQVAAIHSIELPTEPVPRSRPPRFAGGGEGELVEGTVKFYNADKGFGFIVPDDGSKDVFVSARTLTRAGIAALEAEQRVRVATRMGQKGPMAARVEVL
jgi:CspA family cold shock protein